jgi:hypothetical protein
MQNVFSLNVYFKLFRERSYLKKSLVSIYLTLMLHSNLSYVTNVKERKVNENQNCDYEFENISNQNLGANINRLLPQVTDGQKYGFTLQFEHMYFLR